MATIPQRDHNEAIREANPDLAGRILAFVEGSFLSKELYTETVAEHFGISEEYLCRLFKGKTGESLVDFLHRRRIEEAERLLRECDECIYQIADRVGFKSPRYFSKVFKEVAGQSPKTYRRRYIEGRGKDVKIV